MSTPLIFLNIKAEIKDFQERYFAEYPDNYFEPIIHSKVEDFLPVLTNQFPKLIQAYKWGFIPEKAKSVGEGRKYAYAFEKGIVKNFTFRKAVRQNRCIIPVTSFSIIKDKMEYVFKPKEGKFFSIGGVWSRWKDTASDETYFTFAIIETTSNKSVDKFSPVMPLILDRKGEQTWLKDAPLTTVSNCIYPLSPEEMRLFTTDPKTIELFAKKAELNTPTPSRKKQAKDDPNRNLIPLSERNKKDGAK